MTQPKATPLARDYMNRHVQALTPEMTLEEVVSFLLGRGLSSAPVVDQRDGQRMLVGFISEHDCLDHLSNEIFYGASPRQTAGTIMRRHPMCVAPETELFTLASIFVAHGMRHLPVVQAGELLGVVSRRDILAAMEAYYRDLLQVQEHDRRPLDLREIINQRFVVAPRSHEPGQ